MVCVFSLSFKMFNVGFSLSVRTFRVLSNRHFCNIGSQVSSLSSPIKKYHCSRSLFLSSAYPKADTESIEERRHPIGQVLSKFQLSFTCTICHSRVTKFISKQAYTKGVVIAICDGCDSKHLIADNLGWFADASGMRNIEEIMASKGEAVKKKITEDCYEIN